MGLHQPSLIASKIERTTNIFFQRCFTPLLEIERLVNNATLGLQTLNQFLQLAGRPAFPTYTFIVDVFLLVYLSASNFKASFSWESSPFCYVIFLNFFECERAAQV